MPDPPADRVRLADLLHEASASSQGHVEAEELVAYLAGSLDPDRADRVQEHLAGCRGCTQQVLDLEALTPLEEETTSEHELAREWRDFRDRLAPAGSADTRRRLAAAPWAAAAALLLTTLALSLWTVRLQQQVAGLEDQLMAPEINLPVLYLEGVTRSGEVERDEPVGREHRRVLLVITPALPGRRSYGLQLLSTEETQGRELLRVEGLVLSPEGTLRIEVSRELLGEGEIEARVFTPVIAGGERAGEYRLRLAR